MNFNSILIGSEDPSAHGRLLHEAVRQARRSRTAATPSGWSAAVRSPSARTARCTARTRSPGRLIWNIESDDVQGDFERFKAAGAIVIREPYGFEEMPDSLIATFADPDGNYFQLQTPMGPPEG